MQRLEELQKASKPVPEIKNDQKPVVDSIAEVTLQTEENKQILPENMPTEAVNDENKVETEQQNDQAEQPEVPVEEQSNVQGRKPWMNHFDSQRRGMKRKMRGGRGGKRMKTFDGARRPVEPPKPKVVIPLICDLCNVKCDTQEVFDRHLSGKKHISKLKRFEGHQAMYGPMGLQALYPPNPISQTLFPPQGPQQAFYGPQGSYPPPGAYMPPQPHHAALVGSGFQQNPNPQVADVIPEFAGHIAVPEAQQQSALVETETKQDMTVQTYAVNGVSESEGTGQNPPVDNTVTGDKQVNAVAHETVAFPDYGASSDHVILPGLDMQANEGVAD
uniref:U1-type domain-containing protein n=1 Tax=Davidia involucrata TaxID=16924 RepID=A0A5B7ALQ0_DAVIN